MTTFALLDTYYVTLSPNDSEFRESWEDAVTVVPDIENGSTDSTKNIVTNPLSGQPNIYVDGRAALNNSSGLWRLIAFGLDNVGDKAPSFQIERSTKDGPSAIDTTNWKPVFTKDFQTWNESGAVTYTGGTTGTIDFSFLTPLTSGRHYVATTAYGTQADADSFASLLLTTHSAIASPTSSSDTNGVYNVTPMENDSLGRAVGTNNQYGIKLDWGGSTNDGKRKRKLVLMTGIHAAGEQQSWIMFREMVYWALNDTGTEAIAFRSNWDVYLYFNLNPNGIREGNVRHTPRSTTDPNRDWADRNLDEISATYDAIIADTGGDCDVLYSIHGDVYNTDDFIGGLYFPDVASGTRGAVMQSMIDAGTTIFGTSPLLYGASTNNTDAWLGRVELSAPVAFSVENPAMRASTVSSYMDRGTKWMRMITTVDADGEFVSDNVITPEGGLTFSGNASFIVDTPHIITPSGGVVFGGTAGFVVDAGDNIIVPSGGILLSGTGVFVVSLGENAVISPSGGILFSGNGNFTSNVAGSIMYDIRNNDDVRKFLLANGYPAQYNDGLLRFLRTHYGVTHSTLPDLLARYIKENGIML